MTTSWHGGLSTRTGGTGLAMAFDHAASIRGGPSHADRIDAWRGRKPPTTPGMS
jgi:hypothetical protein